VLDAAARLFAFRGVDAVSLRDIAASAGVHLALISRYIGNREALVHAVFEDLSDKVAQAVVDNPLSGHGFGPDTAVGQWVSLAGALVIAGRLEGSARFNPVLAIAKTIEEGYGQDAPAARLRAAQVVAAVLGWRLFEGYLVEAGGLTDVPLETLRAELTRTARRVGATPWPSPPDPEPRRG
jgi:AcrR family transcriptional regulator